MSEDIDVLMQEYTLINEKMKELKDKKANIKANFLIYLKTAEVDRYESETCMLKCIIVKRTSLNKEKLQLDLGDKYNDYIEESESEQIRCVKKEEKQNGNR